MNLNIKPQSVNEVRKKSRVILEKLKDLSSQKKFQKVISKNLISKSVGKDADVQICIHYLLETYKCFLIEHFMLHDYPKRKHEILFNNIKTLEQKITESVKNNNPVPKKYVSNILKAQTIYFKHLKSKKFNSDCSDQYDKFILSAISVWNNDWKYFNKNEAKD